MTDDEQIARFLAEKGVTVCKPAWAAPTSNAAATVVIEPPKKKKGIFRGTQRYRGVKTESQRWAYRT